MKCVVYCERDAWWSWNHRVTALHQCRREQSRTFRIWCGRQGVHDALRKARLECPRVQLLLTNTEPDVPHRVAQFGAVVWKHVHNQGFAAHGEGAAHHAFQAAELLRDHGLAVTLDCSGAGFKSQMKKADASGARYAVLIGADEVAARQVSVKPLRETAEQTRCTVAEAAGIIANRTDSKRG